MNSTSLYVVNESTIKTLPLASRNLKKVSKYLRNVGLSTFPDNVAQVTISSLWNNLRETIGPKFPPVSWSTTKHGFMSVPSAANVGWSVKEWVKFLVAWTFNSMCFFPLKSRVQFDTNSTWIGVWSVLKTLAGPFLAISGLIWRTKSFAILFVSSIVCASLAL